MHISKACILGGTGFVGRHLVRRLTAQGVRCRVLTRHAHRHAELLVNPGCELLEVDPFNEQALQEALHGCDAAINLVGILNEARPGRDFRHVHIELVEQLVSACREAGIGRLLHMSALHADAAAGSSDYLRSKGEGENRAHTLGRPFMAVTSFRPSVIFGPDDSLLNRFATLLRIPGPLPLACPDARFAPVYVGDVVEAMARTLPDRDTAGQRYELCGPTPYTLEELVRLVAQETGRRTWVLRLPDWAARAQAAVFEHLPGKVFTRDNYRSLQTPSLCGKDGLGELGITPQRLDALAPQYLAGNRPAGRLHQLRRRAP